MSRTLIGRFKVIEMDIDTNYELVEYIYEDITSKKPNEITNNINENIHPLVLICEALEDMFNITGKHYIEDKNNTAVIEFYDDNNEDSHFISKIVKNFYKMVNRLLLAEIEYEQKI